MRTSQGTHNYGRVLRAAALALLAIFSAGCGGGSGSDLAGGVDSGGTGITNTVVSGPVNGLGSAIVNGIRFDVSTATILDEEGKNVTPDQIYLGQIARVESASVNSSNGVLLAQAISVQIRSQIVGTVDSVDTASNTLVTMGQSIRITPATWFDPSLTTGFGTGLVGAVVEVYGQYDPFRNQYVATRIAQHLDHTAYKLSGLVTSIDTVSQTLQVGGIAIGYGAIAVANLPTLAVGDLVQARLAVRPINNVWRAFGITIGHISLPDRRDVRMSGRITSLSSTRDFHLDGIKVNARNAIFIGLESAITLGARIKVNGSATKGELNATDVTVVGDETALNSTFELHGTVGSLDASIKSMLVHGVKVVYSAQTQFQSGVQTDLLNGRQIKVTGTIASDKVSFDANSITFE